MLFIGQNIITLQSVDSTNNYAAELLRQSVMFEGTVVVSEFQKKGKGQRGNLWESETGKNLTFSIILFPVFLKAEQSFFLNKIISLGICDFLKSLEISDLSIKWPNDIYIQEKKIAGILIENTIRSDEIVHSIIGIGLNINQEKFNIPNATSMKNLTGKKFSLDAGLENLCSCIEARYLKLKSDIISSNEDYLNSLYQLNEWKKYLIKGENISAKITGVSSQGLLILQKENREEVFCNFKEVVFL